MSGEFQVVQVTLGQCPKAVGDKAGNLIEPGWLKVISFGLSFSNNGELLKVSDLPRTVWGGWIVIALRFKYNWIAEKNMDRNLD